MVDNLQPLNFRYYKSTRARVAKLVDALDLGSSVFDVGVQVPPRAPLIMPFGSIMNGESLCTLMHGF